MEAESTLPQVATRVRAGSTTAGFHDTIVARRNVVNRRFAETNTVIGGVPARVIRHQVGWHEDVDFKPGEARGSTLPGVPSPVPRASNRTRGLAVSLESLLVRQLVSERKQRKYRQHRERFFAGAGNPLAQWWGLWSRG